VQAAAMLGVHREVLRSHSKPMRQANPVSSAAAAKTVSDIMRQPTSSLAQLTNHWWWGRESRRSLLTGQGFGGFPRSLRSAGGGVL